MKRVLVASLTGISLLALTACGESEQKNEGTPAASEQQPAKTGSDPAAMSSETSAPAPDASQVLEGAQKALKDAASALSDEQRQKAVSATRASAEAAAKAAGQGEDMIKQIGDQAEAAAKQALGVQ